MREGGKVSSIMVLLVFFHIFIFRKSRSGGLVHHVSFGTFLLNDLNDRSVLEVLSTFGHLGKVYIVRINLRIVICCDHVFKTWS